MKVIDLLNKIANNDEEVPRLIKINNKKYEFAFRSNDIDDLYLGVIDGSSWNGISNLIKLNDEVEILEEEPRDIEVCGTLFTKSEYDKLAHSEEPKGIPEKLKILPNNEQYSNKVLYGKINEILDYLKSKGE